MPYSASGAAISPPTGGKANVPTTPAASAEIALKPTPDLGKEEVEGTEAWALKVTKASGDEVTLYLDAEYYIEFKSKEKREVQGNEIEFETVIGDYKEVDGLLFAHSMEIAMGGTPAAQVITIEQIELGVEIADDRFTMPEVEEEPAAE